MASLSSYLWNWVISIRIVWLSNSPHVACYDEKTEVLTRDGWKYFDEVSQDDKIASLDPDSQELRYFNPERIVSYDYDGKMYRLESKGISLKVTPNHKLYIRKQSKSSPAELTFDDFELIEARKLYGTASWEYYRACEWNGGEDTLSLDEVKFYAWYLAEGCSHHYSGNYTVQFDINEEEKDYVRNIVSRVTDNEITVVNRDSKGVRLLVRDKALYKKVKNLGDARTKYIPERVKNLPREKLKKFILEYMKGDGWRNSEYSFLIGTSSKQMKDDLQEIGLKAGFTVVSSKRCEDGISKIEDREINVNDSWILSFGTITKTPRVHRVNEREEWVDYSGKVSCVVVPTHIIMVRRNGKSFWCGNTGYGIQTRKIVQYLNEKHEVSIIGLQTHGAPVSYRGIQVLPVFQSTWGEKAVPYWLKRVNPDIFFTLMDIWPKPQLAEMGEDYNFVPYLPVDTNPLPQASQNILNKATFIVPFSKHSERLLEEKGFSNIFRIPHGVDTKNEFYPLEKGDGDLVKFRDMISDYYDIDLESKFIVLTVGVNTGFRKGHAKTMKAISRLSKKHSDLLLWLHCDPENQRGMNLYSFAKATGLRLNKDIIFSPNYGVGRPWPIERMNLLYNLADIQVIASQGEGFALPIIEAQATETPSIYTNFTTARELIGDNERGLLAKVAALWMTPLAAYQAVVNIDDLTNKIDKLYNDRDLIKELGKAGRKYVKKHYDWSKVYPLWDKLLDKKLAPLLRIEKENE